jgi:hypothetical protein
VGYAQKIELEWTQDKMGIRVEPISISQLLPPIFGEEVRQLAVRLRELVKTDPKKACALGSDEQEDLSFIFAYNPPTPKACSKRVVALVKNTEQEWNCAKEDLVRQMTSISEPQWQNEHKEWKSYTTEISALIKKAKMTNKKTATFAIVANGQVCS